MKKKTMSELNRLSVADFKEKDKNKVVIVLDNIRSMHNVGSVFRTADAFLVEEVILCGLTPRPPHRDIHKSALGATETVRWSYQQETKDAITALKNNGYTIAAIEQAHGSIPLQRYTMESKEKIALVFGNEVQGVDDAILSISDTCIEIPQFGSKHSLNISVSVGVVLWEILRPPMQDE